MEKSAGLKTGTSKGIEQEKTTEIKNLDEVVLDALDFFTVNPPPPIDVNEFKFPFVIGSGNALNTGKILFGGKDATFADESSFKSIIASSNKKSQDGSLRDAVIISASGGKDSVWEVNLAKENGLRTTLLTTKPESGAAKAADRTIAFKSVAEPYTYNTSTYMGMMLGATHENPSEIKKFIENLHFPKNFDKYKGYSFVLPDRFMEICSMLDVKESELFGPYVSLRAFSQGHARHAKFVIKSPDELVITLGQKNVDFGDPDHRWDIIDLPQDTDFATIMAATYYIVGKIQESKPPYFKDNIARWASEEGPRPYGQTKPFDVVVPGSEA